MNDEINWFGVIRKLKKMNARSADEFIEREIRLFDEGDYSVEIANLGGAIYHLVTHTVEKGDFTLVNKYNFSKDEFSPVSTFEYFSKSEQGSYTEYTEGSRRCSTGKAKKLRNLLRLD